MSDKCRQELVTVARKSVRSTLNVRFSEYKT